MSGRRQPARRHVIGTSVIVGLVLVAVAVAYGVYLRHVSPGQPALAPAQTAADKAEAQAVLAKAKELYDNYKPGAGADPYAQLETAGLITPTLHIIMNNHKAPYDQVLCAQNQPERFNYNDYLPGVSGPVINNCRGGPGTRCTVHPGPEVVVLARPSG
jgi:hypothetical protein